MPLADTQFSIYVRLYLQYQIVPWIHKKILIAHKMLRNHKLCTKALTYRSVAIIPEYSRVIRDFP